MTTWLLILVGAAAGAAARWYVDAAVQARHDSVFPWGTFTVNVTGSFLLGVLLGVSLEGDELTRLVALVGTGFCGAFTTFSTFSYESVILAEDGASRVAVLNVGASVVVGMAAAFAGWGIVSGLV